MEPQYFDDLAALNKDGNAYIRLLHVHTPSSMPNEGTLCELRVFSLHHAPRYSALSYSRQPGSSIVNIDIQGSVEGPFPISCDLRSAMRNVHRHCRLDWLWVDAICINQSSYAEKNDQVPRMRAIYEDAYAGFVWLGGAVTGEQSDSVDPEEGTCLIHTGEDEAELALGRNLDGKETRGSGLAFTPEKVMQLFESTERHRAWWCRVWVIQEMALPARLYVCVGSQLMRWDQLVYASHDWLSYSYHDESIPDECVLKIMRLDRLRTQWQSAKYSLDLLELLGLGSESHATDTKDNVYGILGLVTPQDKQHILVDYDRAVEQVYAEVTAMLIDKYQTMDIIASSLWHGNEKSQTWSPSWVTNFSTGSYGHTEKTPLFAAEVSLRGYTENGARAGGKTRPSASKAENALKLRLEAIFLDRVIETLQTDGNASEEDGRPMYENEENDAHDCDPHVSQQLQSWLPAATKLFRSSSARASPPSDPRHILQRSRDIVRGLSRADVYPAFCKEFYRSTIANNDMIDDILLSIESLNDELVRERLSSKHVDYERFISDVDHSADSTLFATESGFVGWARPGLRQGSCKSGTLSDTSVRKNDIVVVPRGASLPWVLRGTNVEGEYKLIADCGVCGIMYGELMSLVESGQLQTQGYTLV